MVHALEEGDGLEILAPPMLVGDPLALFPRVIEIEHGGYRIDAKPVEMIAVKPEERVVEQIALNFAAAEIIFLVPM